MSGTSASTPATTAACTPADLGTLGGGQGNAVATSSNGLVIGYADDSTGTPQPVVWRSGQITPISTGLVNVTPAAVNSRGEVIGTGVRAADQEEVGWHWVSGKTTFLQAPAGKVAVPAAISDTGRIVGALAANDDGAAEPTSGEAPEQAAAWPSAGSPAKLLPALAGDVGAHVYGVNNHGLMVGNSQGTDHFTPALWDAAGHVSALAGLGGNWGIARAVNDAGIAVGAAVATTGDPQAMIWGVSHRATKLGWAGGRGLQVTGLAGGLAVGQVDVRVAGDIVRPQAVRWDAAGNATVIPPLPGRPGAGVNDASANGLIVGFSADTRGSRRPTTWTCAS